jgi:hypothetical protein
VCRYLAPSRRVHAGIHMKIFERRWGDIKILRETLDMGSVSHYQ